MSERIKKEESKENNKRKEIILLVLIIVCALSIGLYTLNKYNKRTTTSEVVDQTGNTLVTVYEKDNTEEYTNTMTAKLGYDDNSKEVTIRIKDEAIIRQDYENEESFYKYTNNLSSSDNYLLYKDDNLVKLYDSTTNEVYITNIPLNYNNYDLVTCNDKLLGITFVNDGKLYEEKASYVSFETGNTLYSGKYSEFSSSTCNVVKGHKYTKSNTEDFANLTTIELLNPKEEEVYKTITVKDKKNKLIPVFVIELYNSKGEYFIVEDNSGSKKYNVLEVLAFDGTKINTVIPNIEEIDSIYLNSYIKLNDDGTLYYKDEIGETENTYDISGRIIKQIDNTEY